MSNIKREKKHAYLLFIWKLIRHWLDQIISDCFYITCLLFNPSSSTYHSLIKMMLFGFLFYFDPNFSCFYSPFFLHSAGRGE